MSIMELNELELVNGGEGWSLDTALAKDKKHTLIGKPAAAQ